MYRLNKNVTSSASTIGEVYREVIVYIKKFSIQFFFILFQKITRTDILFFFLLVGFVGFSQVQQRLDSLKKVANYTEFIYLSLDEFVKNPTSENLIFLEKTEAQLWRKPIAKNEILASIYFNVNYGYYLKQFGFLSESVLKYEAAKNLFESTSLNYNIIEFCLKPLANNYTRLGDFNRAEDILKSTIQIAKKSNQTQHLISGYQNLAIVKRTTGNYQTAINYLQEAVKLNSSKQIVSGLYSDMAINYLLLNNLEKTEQFIQLSNSFNIEKKPQLFFINFKTSGTLFFNKNEFEKALLNFNKALNFGLDAFGKNNRENAKVYNSIAKCYVELRRLETAENFYKKALETIIPLNKNIASSIYAENTLKESFDGLAELYVKQNELEKALENYEYSFMVEKAIQHSITSQQSKILQRQEVKKRSEVCIDICYNLFQNSAKTEWLKKAFQFAENSKSSVLNEAKLISNLKSKLADDFLIQQEQQLLFKKAQLTKKITLEELKKEEATISLLANYVNERDEVSNKLQLLKVDLRRKYPNVFSALVPISVAEIQNKILHKNQNLIEFFDGENAIYRFVISKNKEIECLKIEKDEKLKINVLNFIELFASDRGAAIQNNIKNYTKTGYFLYEKLLKGTHAKSLIIIPDGLLNFVPFDALVTEETTSLNFKEIPYLIYKSQIQFTYSAFGLKQNQFKKTIVSEEKFIGYFPIFKNNQRELSTLTYTILEAENIKKSTKGTFLMHKNATKSKFNLEVKEATILHLSTHASAGSFYQPPAIEFYDETLYLPEIYGYNLSADLLVLSACETGLGLVRKGEGAMSLARGFLYAGVKNVLVSLWKVNDKATAELMSLFYKNYAKTNNKPIALHTAKLDYLQSTDVSSLKKSPYYWASFVFIGENQKPTTSTNLFLWLLIIPLLLITSFFLYKKR